MTKKRPIPTLPSRTVLRTVALPAYRGEVLLDGKGAGMRIAQPEDYGALPRIFVFIPATGAWQGIQLTPGVWTLRLQDERPAEADTEILLP